MTGSEVGFRICQCYFDSFRDMFYCYAGYWHSRV
jgi:hypothetical protein